MRGYVFVGHILSDTYCTFCIVQVITFLRLALGAEQQVVYVHILSCVCQMLSVELIPCAFVLHQSEFILKFYRLGYSYKKEEKKYTRTHLCVPHISNNKEKRHFLLLGLSNQLEGPTSR
jgi:hypothetical protein